MQKYNYLSGFGANRRKKSVQRLMGNAINFFELCLVIYQLIVKEKVKSVLRILTNKFVLTAVAFLLLMLFFDQNDWFSQREKEKELDATQQKIDFLNQEVDRMEKELHELNSSNDKLEQYARERYHEKREGEDVYLIIPDSLNPKVSE